MTTPDDENKKKGGGSVIMTIVVVLVLSALAGAGGWIVGMIAGEKSADAEMSTPEAEMAAKAGIGSKKTDKESNSGEGDEADTPAPARQIVSLSPITTNLSYPSNSWVRVEIALVFNGKPDPGMAELVHQDVMAYMRTVSLQQIEGPRGFQHLRDDLSERATIRSGGQVSKLLFRTFLIE
ncbi:flagellar basal body-associated protein FliL [Hoeflea sp. TYP-13]|uniref:flagellar basal body-associated protein FliL n=1 Tax=Hoeflea sp. TYP-13 TaxID=3230023 RepID=UPI0034C64602